MKWLACGSSIFWDSRIYLLSYSFFSPPNHKVEHLMLWARERKRKERRETYRSQRFNLSRTMSFPLLFYYCSPGWLNIACDLTVSSHSVSERQRRCLPHYQRIITWEPHAVLLRCVGVTIRRLTSVRCRHAVILWMSQPSGHTRPSASAQVMGQTTRNRWKERHLLWPHDLAHARGRPFLLLSSFFLSQTLS